MTAPTLRTDRLMLDAHRIDDLDDLVAMLTDPRVYAGIGGRMQSREEIWMRLLRSVGQWALFGYGSWIVRDAGTGAFVGQIGLLEACRAIDPPLTVPEVGWALAPAMQGRGLAQEALGAALAWADAAGIAATCCIIDPGNAASLRLADRLGFVAARAATYHDAAIDVLHRPAAISRETSAV